MTPSDVTAAVVAEVKRARTELTADGPAPGRAWCRAWSGTIDQALRELHDARSRVGRLAVVPVGGFGRCELAPGSDIDLLLLHERVAPADLEDAVRALVYPLWDAGLKVGHSVRTIPEALAIAEEDVDAATSMLDARVLAGDSDLLRTLRTELVRQIRRRPAMLLAGLATADATRRARAGDAAEVLEPDVKNGAGGLRDVQSLKWAAAAVLGEAELDALVAAGYLSAPDRGRLARAYERLLEIRVALHLTTGRATDRLAMDLQDEVAARLGAGDADTLLHEVFLAARTVDHVHRAAWTLMTNDAAGRRRLRRPVTRVLDGGLALSDGVVQLVGEPSATPEFTTHLLVALTQHRAPLARRDAGRIARVAETPTATARWDDASRHRLLSTLWQGAAALPAFAEVDDLGLLAATVPEWAPLRGRPQRNPLHLYSLDRHALHTATALGELVRQEAWAAAALTEIEDREGCMLGALLHDVGKAHGEPHSVSGVPVARAVAARLGAPERTQELVGRIVAAHLTLPDVATRRDLSDPGLATEVAKAVGDRETLACLHLLAAADGRSTGPAAWSSWKAALVAELVGSVRAVLTGPDEADEAVDAAVEAQALAPTMGVEPHLVRAHLAGMSPRYAAAVAARAIVRHASLAAGQVEPGEVRTRVSPGAEGVDTLDVITLDRPGLFAKVAGVLALHGGSILSAYAFTRADGVAIDQFRVRPSPTVGGAWWVAVEGDLVEAVAGRLALSARLARRIAAQRPARETLPPVAVSVEVTRDTLDEATVIEVHARDAVGVLYAIASALAELDLDVVAAKVDTLGHRVVDVFYVRDTRGAPLDPDHADEVVLAITGALNS